jgi:uracil-DNA glycosylase family 4
LKSPKMKPSGTDSPLVYLLGGSPSEEEDEDNNHWTDKAGTVIYNAFGSSFMKRAVRSNFITQCRGERTQVETECCRNRIVSDIERTRPLVVVTIGDEPLAWATRVKGTSLNHRGTLFTAQIGNHVCYVLPLLYPNFVHKKQWKKSEYELTLEFDVAKVKDLVDNGLPFPKVFHAPYDGGIELIEGTEPNDLRRLELALIDIAREPRLSIDIETNGLRPFMIRGAKILTCAVGTFNRVVAFAVDHPEGWGTEARKRAVKSLLLTFLLNSGRKAAHNLAFEMEWFAFEFGGEILRRTEWDDTQGLCHTLDERSGTKSLDVQCVINFGFSLKAQSNLDSSRILEYPLARVLKYNGMDTKWTDKLRDTLLPKVYATEANANEYERKLRLAPTLVLTEIAGLPVDFDYAREQDAILTATLKSIEAKLKRCPEILEYEQRFGTLSPTNPDHILKLMRDVCRRDEIRVEDKRSKAVRWTTDEEALAKIPGKEVPSAALILEHRGAAKLKSTYVDPIIERSIVCPDDMIRAKYSSMVAVTGRLAASDPNIQNWPSRKNKEIRGIVAAPEGCEMVSADYGQIEFRVVGMASEDANLVKHCWTGYDVHKFWAERLVQVYPACIDWVVEEFGVDWDEKGIKTLRQEMKNKWVFPQLFGAALQSCAEQLHLPEWVADDLGGEFWDEFQGVKRWQERLLKNYEKNLYVETLGGRRRRGPMSKNEIINMPIQGTALDIVGAGMDAISERADAEEDQDLQPRLNVHDDLTFVMPSGNIATKVPVIAHEMCKPRFTYINVPLIVEVKTGKRWHPMTEIAVYRSNEIFKTPNPYA